MTFALLLTAAALAVLLSLTAFVQLLYLESLRLRTRDLPALEFFKEKLENALGMKTETGLLSFSLIKHSLILIVGVLILDGFCAGGPVTWIAFTEAALVSWGAMLLMAYLIPFAVYRRTSAEWL